MGIFDLFSSSDASLRDEPDGAMRSYRDDPTQEEEIAQRIREQGDDNRGRRFSSFDKDASRPPRPSDDARRAGQNIRRENTAGKDVGRDYYGVKRRPFSPFSSGFEPIEQRDFSKDRQVSEEKRPPVRDKRTKRQPQPDRVIDVNTTARLSVMLTKPAKYHDAKTVANALKDKVTVVLNLEALPKDEAKRILDFLSGVAFAMNGRVQKIARCTFIITPFDVNVVGDLLYEIENNGAFFL